jgi:hypothetical protein
MFHDALVPFAERWIIEMRKILYEDCNNNSMFMKELFIQVQKLSELKLSWSISNLEFIPVDKGDLIGEMEELYNFQERILDEHKIVISHNSFMELLENIRTIYEGNFEALIRGNQLNIKVFDGDIIEIDGEMENELKIEK